MKKLNRDYPVGAEDKLEELIAELKDREELSCTLNLECIEVACGVN